MIILRVKLKNLYEIQKECQDLFSSTEQALDEISKQEEYTQELIEKISKNLNDTENLCRSYLKCCKHLKKNNRIGFKQGCYYRHRTYTTC